MREYEKYGSDYIHLDQVAIVYGYRKFYDLRGNKRFLQKLRWMNFADTTDWMIRKDVADRFVQAEMPGVRALPVGESICGSGKICCNSKIPNSLYCTAEDRRELIFELLESPENLESGLPVIGFIHYFVYLRRVPCLLREESSLRLELFQLCAMGYLLEIKGTGDSKRYRLNTTPRPIHLRPGRPKGS